MHDLILISGGGGKLGSNQSKHNLQRNMDLPAFHFIVAFLTSLMASPTPMCFLFFIILVFSCETVFGFVSSELILYTVAVVTFETVVSLLKRQLASLCDSVSADTLYFLLQFYSSTLNL